MAATKDLMPGVDGWEVGAESVLSTTKEEYERNKEAHDCALGLNFELYKSIHFPEWKDSHFKILQYTYPDGQFVIAWYTIVPKEYFLGWPPSTQPVITPNNSEESSAHLTESLPE